MLTDVEDWEVEASKKSIFISEMKFIFNRIRYLMEMAELHIFSEDKEVEARALIIATNLIVYMNDFLEEMQTIIKNH